ncbi:MAG TPA: adenylate/guanylate cyclase domain-containing protein [Gaiellaceae bacterium]|nr:adenylate/guanylate cyclase domain-containing protein [Gaiellaceae bacterium]
MADAVTCPSCGSANEPGRKFCGECGTSLALTCPSCGSANTPGVKFCGECGTRLTVATSEPAAAPAAERRHVSVLFADLVGFTTASEERDAEDTRELLSRYFETARTIVERYGGTVEKFIGDAVMAVWGTPVAQEDDAERAVRAALDLVGAVPDLDAQLRARAGVLTGEAAITIGAEGQGMVAGDLVNTASRVQSAAEPSTVLVGDATKRAAEAAIAFEDAGEHELKGKAEVARLWRALRVVATRGGEARSQSLEAPFVGRDRELRLVQDLYHSCAEDGRATLVTVVGVAGIGKSRLAWELEKHLDGVAGLVWWHRGRCLAYGEGVAFWALAEMVRMRAGIAEDEPEEAALTKLEASVREHVADHGEREWVQPHLRHLLGLGDRSQAERSDLFSAWRLFFERMSETAPVALVFEDLHWADTALLDFVEHLLEWSRAKPIYVLALTRPELLDRRGDFGARSRSSTTLALEPLSDEAMDALLDGLVPGMPDDVRTQIRERADGIPLYAVETVRMLIDRGALERDGDALRVVGPLERLDVPETLHALIAARLDGLDPDERLVVQHASVLGKTFAARGLVALGAVSEESLAPVLDALVRKELLAIDRDPRSPERGQYGFLQALVQRVAYETLSRKERARLHRAAAAYLEHDAGIDADEIAEVIAAHHRDAGDADQARAWLERAGERAAALGAPEDGQRAFDDAAAIADEPLERARLLERAGKLAFAASRLTDAEERLRRAVETFTDAGDTHAGARAAASLGVALWGLGRSENALATLRPAFDALSEEERDADVGRLAAELARIEHFTGDAERARHHIEIALDIAEECEDLQLVSTALNTKSLIIKARPHEQHALLREALRLAEGGNFVEETLRAINNLVVLAEEYDRPTESRELLERGLALARERGHRQYVAWFGGGLVAEQVEDGDWNRAVELAREVIPEDETTIGNLLVGGMFLAKASFERGDDQAVTDWLSRVPEDLARSTDIQLFASSLYRDAIAAMVAGRLGDGIEAYVKAWDTVVADERWHSGAATLEWAANAAVLLGNPSAGSPLLHRYEAVPDARRTRMMRAHGERLRAFAAIAAGDENAAADAFAEALAAARSLGRPGQLAPVLADYGVWLAESGRGEDAAALLDEAQELFERMGAQRWLDHIASVRGRTAVATR